ncbi:sodium:proton antiporter, partial [Micrococcus endophyticus]
ARRASGKGGVGKSSVTANLAVALAARGLAVGLIDADVHGYSIPGLLGVTASPTKLDRMILPPVVRDVKVISIGMFLDEDRPVAWRGPMLHRALEQFVTDVHWGDLDVLLVDLPPGTGDIAISTAQLLPASELLVVTTPQHAAAQVAA